MNPVRLYHSAYTLKTVFFVVVSLTHAHHFMDKPTVTEDRPIVKRC